MWDSGDKENYEQHTANSLGQICNDTFSKDIEFYASNTNFKTFLEIGTWKK